MRIFLFSILLTCSLSCLANEFTNFKMPAQNLLKETSITNYYKKPQCNNFSEILEKASTEFSLDSKTTEALLVGFTMGVYEQNPNCVKNENLYKKYGRFLAGAFWSVYGDGAEKREKRIDYSLEKHTIFSKFSIDDNSLALLIGYFYATGNREIVNSFHHIIEQAKKEHCFNSVVYTRRDCPTAESIEFAKTMLENNYAPNRKLEDLEIIQKSQTNECNKQLREDKEGQCPTPTGLYIASQFLEKYDTTWYKTNIKDWLSQKEFFYQKTLKKEQIERENQRIQHKKEANKETVKYVKKNFKDANVRSATPDTSDINLIIVDYSKKNPTKN